MGLINKSKSAMGPMNSSKNKLNSEIILIFNPNPNAHLVCVWDELNFSAYLCFQFIFATIHKCHYIF